MQILLLWNIGLSVPGKNMLFVKCAVGDYYYMVGGGVHVGYEVCEAGSPLALDNE